MSHLSKLQVSVDSMDMLKRVLDRMGKAYKQENTTITDTYRNNIRCELYLTDHKVGFRQEDGKYVAEADWMYSGLKGQEFLKQFNESAAQIKVEDACKAKSYNTGRWVRNEKSGNLEMIATSWA